MRRYQCRYCADIYDERLGDPDRGIAPGTRYDDLPDDWTCANCGAAKGDFDLLPDDEHSEH